MAQGLQFFYIWSKFAEKKFIVFNFSTSLPLQEHLFFYMNVVIARFKLNIQFSVFTVGIANEINLGIVFKMQDVAYMGPPWLSRHRAHKGWRRPDGSPILLCLGSILFWGLIWGPIFQGSYFFCCKGSFYCGPLGIIYSVLSPCSCY